MSESDRIDPERLAALLDGRLSDSDAAAVRRQLANANDATLAAFADAVGVIHELEADQAKDVRPISSARSWRRFVLPAGIAIAATLVVIATHLNRAALRVSPSELVAGLPSNAQAPADAAWPAMRGEADRISDRARAARLGALLTDLRLDADRGDSTLRHVETVVALTRGVTAGGPIAAWLEAVPAEQRSHFSNAQIDTLERSVAQLMANDADYLRAGAYLEAARIAADAGDTNFFQRQSPDVLSAVRQRPEILADTSITNAISEFLIAAKTPGNLAALHASATRTLARLAR